MGFGNWRQIMFFPKFEVCKHEQQKRFLPDKIKKLIDDFHKILSSPSMECPSKVN
jgi:hypothetical protein